MRRSASLLAAIASTVMIAGPATTTLAATDQPTAPAFANTGDASPSLSLSVSPTGEPEAATVGPGGSLWFSYLLGGTWHRVRVGPAGTAGSGPSLAAGAGGKAYIAVQGARHSLQYYALSAGHWHHLQVAGPNTTYSAPSLALSPHGQPGIAAQGTSRTLWYYSLASGHWHGSNVFGKFAAYSAPSLVIRGAAQATSHDPAGQADIAVENANHSLSYYFAKRHGGWASALILGSVGTIFTAPSLAVFTGMFRGQPYAVAQGAGHSMTMWGDSGSGWHRITTLPALTDVHSTPSLVQGDTFNLPQIAFRGPSRTIRLLYYNNSAGHWIDELIATANGNGSSAPALVNRSGHPAHEDDLLFQGLNNSLWYLHAAAAASPTGAPNFHGGQIAGAGTTYGG